MGLVLLPWCWWCQGTDTVVMVLCYYRGVGGVTAVVMVSLSRWCHHGAGVVTVVLVVSLWRWCYHGDGVFLPNIIQLLENECS